MICSSVRRGIFSVVVVLYEAYGKPIQKKKAREVGLLQKSPQQAWAFKGHHPGLVAIGFGG